MIPPNIIYYTCSRIQYGLYAIYSRDLIVKLAYCFQFFQVRHFSKSTLSNTGEKKKFAKRFFARHERASQEISFEYS